MYGGREALRLRALRALTDRTLSRADRVFVLSEQAFTLIDRELLAGKAEVIPMSPPHVDGMAPSRQAPPSEPYLLIVGDLFRYKGVETAIRALASLPAPRPLLLVAGRDSEPSYVRQLERLSVAMGVADRVRLLGSKPHDEVLALMARSLCCIVPSRFENLSHVPLEAMAVGTPVIASDIPGSREACEDAAVYFPVLDSGRLAHEIQRLASDDGLREQLVRAGRARAGAQPASSASEQMLRSIEALG
jgi:glycosyltransferase involved in cell wall biosynthesis